MKESKSDFKGLPALIIIVIVLFIATICYSFFTQLSADEYIIPYGYTGKVTVIYRQPTGEPVKESGQKRQFHIPASGILVTQSEYIDSKVTEFYYRRPDSTLELLSQGPVWCHGMIKMEQVDTFSVSDFKTSFVDSLKATQAVFTVVKSR